MKNKFWQILQFSKYLLRCIHLHGIHSPFAFELQHKLFKEKAAFYTFDEIEALRAKLLLTTKEIIVEDLGAGSQVHSSNKRSIQAIAKTSLKPAKKAQLLYRFVQHFKPETTVELGTCLGITSCYLAKGNTKGELYTLEGSSELSKIARINFNKLNIKNITQTLGNFDDTLVSTLEQIGTVDFIFFDGNHQKVPTLTYFEQALKHKKDDSVFVFDDIYWSKGMTEAWQEIKQHSSVTATIDCFEMGFVFFKKDQAKEHFTVYH